MCERSYATLEVGDAVLVENYKWSQKLVSAADPGLGYTWEASLRAICSDELYRIGPPKRDKGQYRPGDMCDREASLTPILTRARALTVA